MESLKGFNEIRVICAVNTAPLKNANTAVRDLARVTTPVGEINVLRLFL